MYLPTPTNYNFGLKIIYIKKKTPLSKQLLLVVESEVILLNKKGFVS